MSRKLVLFFSVYGTARRIAEEIARQARADLMEIEPTVPYDSNKKHYDALARAAKREMDENQRPSIKNHLPVSEYDVIFLGYPIWWYSLPMIIRTLFDQYDFSEKTILPFNTHMGSRDSSTWQIIQALAPKALMGEGLSIEMEDVERDSGKAVAHWLGSLYQDKRPERPFSQPE
ncbi:MAG: NAD(P)H-dependent oxidoreductase [Clostridia bacterium]|nr:NAD(P)H-dependent oxidoreductase [Clostridia bacterium]